MLMVTETCPTCGEELDGDNAASGLCAACLLERAIDFSSTVSLSDRSTSGTLPFTPPETVEVEADLLSYDVLELVGRGGMGAVYKARQRNLDRVVAIKVLPRNAGTPEFADRFQREARALARLRHENIVMAYDFGLTERYSYCVMEFVAGPNLRQLMRRGPLTPERALSIARDVCRAIQYAHASGIVHRDIKPENVLLTEAGEVKLADFGLAKLLERDELDFALTCTQHFMGTLHYMAPEQCERPHETDHRADIYSAGVLLYEMLTGELPLGRFDSPSARGTVGEDVDQLVLRALEKDPAKRFATGGEFADAIDLSLADLSRLESPEPAIDSNRRRSRRRAWIAAGFLGLLAIVWLGWQLLFKYERDKDGNTKIEASVTSDNDQPLKASIAQNIGDVEPTKRNPFDAPLPSTTDIARDMRVFPLRFTPAQEAADYLKERYHDAGYAIAMDQASNSVLVRARPEQLETIEALLSRLEEKSEKKSDLRGDPATKSGKAPTDRPAHKIQPGDVLYISTAGTPVDAPIEKTHTVDVDGYVNLGAEYGKVRVVGMTADEAQKAVLTELRKFLRNPQVVISIVSVSNGDRDPRSGPNRFEVSGRGRRPDYPNTPRDPDKHRGHPGHPDRQNVPNDPNDPTNPRGTDIQPGDPIQIIEPDKNSVAVLPYPQWSEAELNAKSWPERKEDLPIALRMADDQLKQFGALALEYRYQGDTPLTIGSKEGDMVIPYILVISGDHLGRKEYVMSWWPVRKEHNTLDRTPGILLAPRDLRIKNGDPLEIFVERGDPRTSARVRVSNIVKVKWEIPGTPKIGSIPLNAKESTTKPNIFGDFRWLVEQPQTKLNNTWYDVVAVNNMPVADLVAAAKNIHGDEFRHQFETDLPRLLRDIKQLQGEQVTFQLRAEGTEKVSVTHVDLRDLPSRMGDERPDSSDGHEHGDGHAADSQSAKVVTLETVPELRMEWKRNFPHITHGGRPYALDRINDVLSAHLIEEAKKISPDDVPRSFMNEWPELLRRLKQPIRGEIELTVVGPVTDAGGTGDRAAGEILVLKYRRNSAGVWHIRETTRLETLGPAKRLPAVSE